MTLPVADIRGFVRIRREDLDDATEQYIRSELTFRPKAFVPRNLPYKPKPPEPVRAYMQNAQYMLVPRFFARQHLTTRLDLRDCTSMGMDIRGVRFTGVLGAKGHPEQARFVDEVVAGLQRPEHGGWGLADTGTGKTILACEIACRLGVSTLILVHKGVLQNQWVKTLEEHFVLPDGSPVRCGIVQRDRCDYGPQWPFAVATVQSLTSREYPADFYRAWGMTAVDEGHHTTAPSWVQILARLRSRYLYHTTATKRRKDGLEGLFDYLAGPVLSELRREKNPGRVTYRRVPWPRDLALKDTTPSAVTKAVMQHPSRASDCAGLLVEAHKANRITLVLAHEIAHLEDLFEHLPMDMRTSVAKFWGTTTREQEEALRLKPITLATYQKAGEGFNREDLDLGIIYSPIGDAEQAVGRIRGHNRAPRIVYYADTHPKLVRRTKKVARQLVDLGWTETNQPPEAAFA